jgi:tetratricopeptide (TPR) repeat protein
MADAVNQDSHISKLKWAFHYHTLLHELEVEFQAAHESDSEALREFHDCLLQLRGLQKWCAEHLEDDMRAAIMCSKLAGVGGELLHLCLSKHDLIRWREAGLAGARKANLPEDVVGHLTYLSYAHFTNNNPTRALELLDEAAPLARELPDPTLYATVLQHQGMFYARLDRIDEAIAALEESIPVYEKNGDLEAVAKSEGALATCYSRLNEPERAVTLYERAIDHTSQEHGRGTYLSNLAGELITLKRYDEAWSCLLRAQAIADTLEDGALSGLVVAQMGLWYGRQEDAELRSKAIELLEKAVDWFRRTGEKYHEEAMLQNLEFLYHSVLTESPERLTYEQQSYALRHLIQIELALAHYDEMMQYCRQLTQIAVKERDLQDQLEAAISLGHAAMLSKDFKAAISAHNHGLKLLSRLRKREGNSAYQTAEAELLLSLGQAYRHSGRASDAAHCYERARTLAHAELDFDMEHRAVGNLGLILADMGRFTEADRLLLQCVAYYEGRHDTRLASHARFNQAHVYHLKGN